jgi:hypothetical protein
MKEGFASVDARFKAIDARFETFDARFNARFDKIEETLSHHFKYMKNISLGLGRSLEAYTGGWLAEMLRSRGIENPESLIYSVTLPVTTFLRPSRRKPRPTLQNMTSNS